MSVRPAAVAGTFYPSGAVELQRVIARALAESKDPPAGRPVALIAPHAGYIYSGSTAATAYRCLQPFRGQIRRLVVLGPAHRVPFAGMALPEANAFNTPLGDVPIDAAAREQVMRLPGVLASDVPHAQEHSLEVHLPFLQTVLGEFSLLPIVVGDAPPGLIAPLIQTFLDDPATAMLVSSDLSHFHRYDEARRIDADTVDNVLSLQGGLVGEQACGARPINGLLRVARSRGWKPRLLSQCNSGDTAGDRQRVVGYASIGFYDDSATH